MSEYVFENLGNGISICVGDVHRFGTDAFLLSDFAKALNKDTVVDLCTGSGIVALLTKKNFSPKKIIALDIQDEAIKQLNMSIEKSGITGFTALCGDLKSDVLKEYYGSVDLVTCNPPYKINDTGAKNEIDAVTIARHEVLCNIDDVCKAASDVLRFGGRVAICNRPERLADVIMAMKKHNLEPKRLRFVSKNPNTAPWLFLIEGKKGSRPFLQVMNPLYTQGEGGFSDELLKIYGKSE